MKDITLLSDQSIGEGRSYEDDGLGFETYGKVLAAAARGTTGPFTIGVFGEWGVGKTSLLRIIESELREDAGNLTVWFNAWQYEKEEHPLVPLLATIVQSIESKKGKTFRGRLGKKKKQLVQALRAVAYGVSAKSKLKVPGFAEIEASLVAKDMIERAESITSDPLLDQSLYFDAFQALSATQLSADSRIVVLIDDLDRCLPDQAVRLLNSIKLVLAQPGFVFVLGVARRVIEGYLQHRYTKEFGISGMEGQRYLDKIVQLSFHIPPHAGRMERLSEVVLRQVPPEIGKELESVLPIVGRAMGANPRSMVRFVNNILIDLAVCGELAAKGEQVVIPVEFFAVSRCLEQHWPQVFRVVTTLEGLPAEIAGWSDEEMAVQSRDEGGRGEMARNLRNSPDLVALFRTEPGQAWLLKNETRRASIDFLKTERQAEPETDGKLNVPVTWDGTWPRKQVFALLNWLTNRGLKPNLMRLKEPYSQMSGLQLCLVTEDSLGNWDAALARSGGFLVGIVFGEATRRNLFPMTVTWGGDETQRRIAGEQLNDVLLEYGLTPSRWTITDEVKKGAHY